MRRIALAATTSLILLFTDVPAGQRATGSAAPEHWSGNFLDANGRVGRIELDAAADGRSGTLTILISERDSSRTLTREVRIDPERATMRLRTIAGRQGADIQWQASLTREDAAPHAKAALLGQYSTGGANETSLSRGVMILWLFAK